MKYRVVLQDSNGDEFTLPLLEVTKWQDIYNHLETEFPFAMKGITKGLRLCHRGGRTFKGKKVWIFFEE